MDARVGEGAASARRFRNFLTSSFSNLTNHVAQLSRPGPAFKFLTVLSIVGLLAQIPAKALITPTSTIGATPGGFAVSPSGAATYTIPMVAAPGTNGMQPNFALVYNSQSGNGLLGVGWSLSGLSAIHRCGATIEIDGFKGGVNYDANDRFCLDGERLIYVGNNQYRTNRESLQKVIASDASTNPAYFTVTDKDGTVREYAVSIEAAGNPSIRRLWALSKIKDTSGNYLTIAYDKSDVATSGDYRISRIDYAANGATGTGPSNSVVFGYVGRSDVVPMYQHGSPIATLKLLSNVTTYAGSTKDREYRLSYDTSGTVTRSRLVSVQECGTDGLCLPATSLQWTSNETSFDGASASMNYGTYTSMTNDTGDVNGDGCADVVRMDTQSQRIWAYISNCNGTFQGATESNVYGTYSSMTNHVADINGDGCADIVRMDTQTQRIWGYISNCNGTFQGATESNVYGTIPSTNDLADMNGDGCADAVRLGTDRATIWVYLSTCNGSFKGATESNNYGTISTMTNHLADVNGDGCTDVVRLDTARATMWTYLSNCNGVLQGATEQNNYGTITTMTNHLADINGDGLADVVRLDTQTQTIWSYLRLGGSVSKVSLVTDGIGVATSIAYKTITDASVYARDVGVTYPYQNVQDSTYVVASNSSSNGIGTVNTTTYQYTGLKRHLQANISLGFRRIEATDAAGLLHRTDYNQNREGGIDGTVAGSFIYASGYWVKNTLNTWESRIVNCGSATTRQPQLVATYEDTRELSNGNAFIQINASTTYDSCGFPQTTVVDYNDGWRRTTTNTNQNDTTNWILGRVTQTQITAEALGQPAKTRTTSFAYRPDGLTQSETIEPGNSLLSVTTTYDYDGFGNRKSKTVSGADIATRTEYYEYDSQLYQGRFLTKKINALGQATAYEYDPRNGQPTKMTDPNGLITQWDYDGFGRKGLEISPNGKQSTISYLPGTDEFGGQGYSVVVNTEGAGDSETFYDSLGRAYKWRTAGFGGSQIYKRIVHDNLGRVVFKSHPEFNAPSTHGVSYGYDVLGRVTMITEPGPTPRETTTDYNGLTTTVTNALGQRTVTIKNSQGKPISVTEAEGTADVGTTQYEYDPFLNLTKVIDPAGNQTTMAYDNRGRKIGMNDPDMGAWSYEYDVLGELKKQTDAKGQQITMGYDVLGRMTSRATPEGQSTWGYDTGTKAIGKLSSVSGPNSYQESYVYEPQLGLLASTTYTIAGTNYPVTRSYDSFSRLETVTYPSGYTIKQIYDGFGYLWMVNRLNGATESLIWQTDVADAHARVVREIYGNNLESVRGYDHETNDLTTIQTGVKDSGAPTIQNLAYGYDALHNLQTRSDTITGLNESFDYDNLNRLKQATGAVTKTYGYNSIGNIITKSDVGTYSYPTNGVRPHAVTSVAGPVNASYTYDDNGNMLSGAGRTIGYTSFNKPQSISGPSGSVTLAYDANYNRIQKFAGRKTITYVGKLFEREVDGTLVQDKSYVYAGNSLVAIYTSRNNSINDNKYVQTDHVGSVNVITDENGVVIPNGRFSYDPHGKRRQTNGQDATGPIVSDVNRGFTRHEHDDEVGLINMNARLYDPLLGRFITSDSIYERPVGQGLNRYSYVLNNPLTLVDPTGQWSLKKALRRIVRKVSEIKNVGGLLATGLLSNPIFAPHYGAATGDWKSVGRATATAGVFATGIWAGGSLAQAYAANPGFFTGVLYVTSSAELGYATGYAVARVNGASPAEARALGLKGAKSAAIVASLYVGYRSVAGMTPEQASNSENTIGSRRPDNVDKPILCPEGGGCSQKLYDANLGIQATSRIHDPMTGSAGVGFRQPSVDWLAKFVDMPVVGDTYNFATMPIAFLWTQGAYAAQFGVSPALIWLNEPILTDSDRYVIDQITY